MKDLLRLDTNNRNNWNEGLLNAVFEIFRNSWIFSFTQSIIENRHENKQNVSICCDVSHVIRHLSVHSENRRFVTSISMYYV